MNGICYACDDTYAELAAVSLESLLSNATNLSEIEVYIFEEGISAEHKDTFTRIASKHNVKLSLISTVAHLQKLKEISNAVDGYKGSYSYFTRVYIADLLPKYINRALYLDCDLLMIGDINQLLDFDMKGYAVAAVLETRISAKIRHTLKNDNTKYFNSGVMVIDLEKWSSNGLETRAKELVLERVQNNTERLRDQPLINAACNGNIAVLHPRFNLYAPFQMYSNKQVRYIMKIDPEEFYSDSELNEAKDNPVILHYYKFNGARPWEPWCYNPTRKLWLKYASQINISFKYRLSEYLAPIPILQYILYHISPKVLCAVNAVGSAWKNL